MIKLFSNLFRKTTKDVKFEKVEYNKNIQLENQNGVINVSGYSDIDNYLQIMFEDTEQFITLTLSEPINDIRYIQACRVNSDICVQLGIEKDNNTVLIEKKCSKTECDDIFREFYYNRNVNDIHKYKPVKFF